MSFRKFFWMSALVVLGCASAARAQLGVYGTVSAENLKGITCVDPQGICANNHGTAKPYGGTAGVYYDFKTYGPVRLGADLRGTFLNSNKSAFSYSGGTDLIRHYAFLGGVRATFHTPYKLLRPYAQGSVGYGHSNAAGPKLPTTATPGALPGYQNYTQIQGFAGLDLALFPNLDFRVIEFGIGEMFGPSSHQVQTIGLGVVFHGSRDTK